MVSKCVRRNYIKPHEKPPFPLVPFFMTNSGTASEDHWCDIMHAARYIKWNSRINYRNITLDLGQIALCFEKVK